MLDHLMVGSSLKGLLGQYGMSTSNRMGVVQG